MLRAFAAATLATALSAVVHGAPPSVSAYQAGVLATPGLVAYFPFEGSYENLAPGAGTVAPKPGLTTSFAPAFASTLGEQAVRFDGSENSVINLGPTQDEKSVLAALNGATAISIEFWVDFGRIEQNGGLLYIPGPNRPAPGYSAIAVRLGDSKRGTVSFAARSQAKDAHRELVYATKENGLTHIVGVIDFTGQEIRIYANGELVHSDGVSFGSPTLQIPVGPNPVIIGRNLQTILNGSLDELALYARALTSEEIKTHYQVGSP